MARHQNRLGRDQFCAHAGIYNVYPGKAFTDTVLRRLGLGEPIDTS